MFELLLPFFVAFAEFLQFQYPINWKCDVIYHLFKKLSTWMCYLSKSCVCCAVLPERLETILWLLLNLLKIALHAGFIMWPIYLACEAIVICALMVLGFAWMLWYCKVGITGFARYIGCMLVHVYKFFSIEVRYDLGCVEGAVKSRPTIHKFFCICLRKQSVLIKRSKGLLISNLL